MRDPIFWKEFETLPQHVKEAFLVFTSQERSWLTVFVAQETGRFEFIAFHDSVTNRATKPTDERKLAALDILDEEYRRYEKEVLGN